MRKAVLTLSTCFCLFSILTLFAGEDKLSIEKVFSEKEEENYIFNPPPIFAIDHDLNIYVFDRVESKVYKYNSTGEFISSFGREGRGPGEFYIVTDMDICDKKIIFSSMLGITGYFSLDGKYIDEINTHQPQRIEDRKFIKEELFIQHRLLDTKYSSREIPPEDRVYTFAIEIVDLAKKTNQTIKELNIKASEIKNDRFPISLVFEADHRGRILFGKSTELDIYDYSSRGEILFNPDILKEKPGQVTIISINIDERDNIWQLVNLDNKYFLYKYNKNGQLSGKYIIDIEDGLHVIKTQIMKNKLYLGLYGDCFSIWAVNLK